MKGTMMVTKAKRIVIVETEMIKICVVSGEDLIEERSGRESKCERNTQ
jgi:hypothetical protein